MEDREFEQLFAEYKAHLKAVTSLAKRMGTNLIFMDSLGLLLGVDDNNPNNILTILIMNMLR